MDGEQTHREEKKERARAGRGRNTHRGRDILLRNTLPLAAWLLLLLLLLLLAACAVLQRGAGRSQMSGYCLILSLTRGR